MWYHGEMITRELQETKPNFILWDVHILSSSSPNGLASPSLLCTSVVRNHDHLVWNYQLLAKKNVQISGAFGSANKLGQIGNIFHVQYYKKHFVLVSVPFLKKKKADRLQSFFLKKKGGGISNHTLTLFFSWWRIEWSDVGKVDVCVVVATGILGSVVP